jgi:hypothetical protein
MVTERERLLNSDLQQHLFNNGLCRVTGCDHERLIRESCSGISPSMSGIATEAAVPWSTVYDQLAAK